MSDAPLIAEHERSASLRLALDRRSAELRELLRDGGVIDSFGPGYRDKALAALAELRDGNYAWIPKE